MSDATAGHLAQNIRRLRALRGLSQQRLAELSGMPRSSWANLESGSANPTLAVLVRVAGALQITIEELLGPPRAVCRLYRPDELRQRTRGSVRIRDLLPDPMPGLHLERLTLPPRGRFTGVPHTPGTREYLVCERGQLELTAAGQTHLLTNGDVLVFRGDQRHSYHNPGDVEAIGYSAVLLTGSRRT